MPPTSPKTATPREGGTYTFTGDQLGQRADTALMPGTVVTVREVVPANVSGAHTDTEDAVVIEWQTEGQVITGERLERRGAPVLATNDDGSIITDESGAPTYRLETREVPVYEFGIGPISRAMSVSTAQFATDFQEA